MRGQHAAVVVGSTSQIVTREYWNPLGLDLTGLAKVGRENEAEFAPLMDELMIKYEYDTGVSIGTEMRLANCDRHTRLHRQRCKQRR